MKFPSSVLLQAPAMNDMPLEDTAPILESWTSNEIVEWLLLEGWNLPDFTTLVAQLGRRLVQAGVAVDRIRVTMRTLHPTVVGFGVSWEAEGDKVDSNGVPHELLETPLYLESPYRVLFEQNAAAVRRRLDIPAPLLDFPILQDLIDDGYTDYVALPIHFSGGRKKNAITLASKRPGGLTGSDLKLVYDALPALARILETFQLRLMSRELLTTYIGKWAGDRVFEGRTRRGDVDTIDAVIWFCDLRASTRLAESMPPEAFLNLLNRYFDCMAGAVMDHGGEVLRFIGDAMLAIFPIQNSQVDCGTSLSPQCRASFRSALDAARDAAQRLETYNDERRESGEEALEIGIALHVGRVLYGNVGTASRLEFTVTGAAANYAARVEGLCKVLHETILVSQRFAEIYPGDYRPLGSHVFKGYEEPQPVFGLDPKPRND